MSEMESVRIRICNACGARASVAARFCPVCASLSLTDPLERPVSVLPRQGHEPASTTTWNDAQDEEDDCDEDQEFDLSPREFAELVLPEGIAGPELPPGVPSLYQCLCNPVGRFTISYKRHSPQGSRWELAIEGTVIRQFPDHLEAMLAVCHFRTGLEKWDRLEGTVTPPEDSDDWERY